MENSRNRPGADPARCPVMCGRLRVGKDFLHVLQHWSVQPCVRPFDAVNMTAGHNAPRGSGPDQTPAFDNASTQLGCPYRRIDRLCSAVRPPNLHITPVLPPKLLYTASSTGPVYPLPLPP